MPREPFRAASANRHGSVYKTFLEARSTGRATDVSLDSIRPRLYKDFVSGSGAEEAINYFEHSHYTGKGPRTVGPTGGIFNLEYNTDGSLLAAACEQKSVLLFDPNSRRLLQSIEKAHDDCVNCVRFLDARTFATCSDDATVALWDARFLKSRVRTLKGHSSWVKNVEFSAREGCLVTSGFDGAVYAWDINRYSEKETGRVVFKTDGLMRMRLSSFGDKMVLATLHGYIMVVHDLCLESLAKDLKGFKPHVYRMMQKLGKGHPTAVGHTHLFHSKRNRVELISDFAPNNDAETISSLQLHPQGWVSVSRNISEDESSEFCCVHDIHGAAPPEDSDELVSDVETAAANEPASAANGNASSPGITVRLIRGEDGRSTLSIHSDHVTASQFLHMMQNSGPSAAMRAAGVGDLAGLVLVPPQLRGGIFNLLYSGAGARREIQTQTEKVPDGAKMYRKNAPRLTHYIEEANTGRGFIKEVAFSADGRVLCSPFGFGLRLLAFDADCSDLGRLLPASETDRPDPTKLHEVGMIANCHNQAVLACAFAPHHFTIATGCLAGKIAWHQPRP